MSRPVIFQSALAPYIEDLIKEKRAMGYKYVAGEDELLRLDKYFSENGINTPNLTKDMVDKWCEKTPTEAGYGQAHRIGALTQLSKYLNSIGITAYVPIRFTIRPDRTLPHILKAEELDEFFNVVDNYKPALNMQPFPRMTNEYKVLFRMLYSCGMRNSEASTLPVDKIDLKDGIITVESKKDKTRLVYMDPGLTALCQQYFDYLVRNLGFYPEYFFPGRNPSKPVWYTSIDAVFRKYWSLTSFGENCNNPPTPHDLRFTFITNRIDDWASKGYDIDAMMLYLSQYVGHSDIQETYYYYHLTSGTFNVIRQKDKTSELVIPEVKYGKDQ